MDAGYGKHVLIWERGRREMDTEKDSPKMRIFPVEYLWDGYVLNNDIFNHTGAVKLLAKGEKIEKSRLDKLMRFSGNDKHIMVYDETYRDLMANEKVPLFVRQKMTEQYSGYAALQQNVGSLFHKPDFDSWLDREQMEPLAEEITGKVVNFDPLTILSCISFPRPMDEGLQRHSLNVALLNAMQAEWLGLGADDIKLFTLAGLLHDIGKTMIPEEILNAPRRLTAEELAVMREHPVYSDRLLCGKFDENVRFAARHHHEKLDGTGYPDGISGEGIGLCARVTAISDIYDAMVPARSYKDSRLPLNVLNMFYEEEFDGLDRRLVMLFLKNMRLKYTNREVVMSNGEKGTIRYIPLNDAGHPIIQQNGIVRQADEEWYCREMVALYP